MNNFVLSILVPLVSFVAIAVYAIVLGFIFYQLHHHTALGTIGVILLGLVLLISTTVIAYFLEKRTNS